MTEFWNVLREVDPQYAIREADQPLRVIICGRAGAGKRTLARGLFEGECSGVPGSSIAIDILDMPDDVPVALPTADLYLYVAREGDELGPLQRNHLRQLSHRSGRVIRVVNRSDVRGWSTPVSVPVDEGLGIIPGPTIAMSIADRQSIQRELVPRILKELPQLALPMGRHLTTARDPAADFLIADTARVNAEFAIISSLPALVPVVGTLASVGTDMIILTKNQVMLLLKLALMYQRPIDNRMQVFAEVAPVIGAAFFWRSAARSLVAMLPGPLAIAPRGAVAYVGTYVMGRAGQYYYRSGMRPSADLLDSFREDALRQLGGFTPLLARVGRRFKLP
ncbi:MAG: hypothetical protein ACRDIY_00690 [Chloroflexota bacterium]